MSGHPHVLHVIDGLGVGGGEQVLASLVKGLQAVGWRNTVVSLMQPGSGAARLEAAGTRVEGLSFGPGRLSVPGLHRLAGAIRRHRPDVIQGWMHHGNLAATVGRALARSHAPMFWSIHNTVGPREDTRLHTRAAVRLGVALSGWARKVVYVSEVSARQHEELGFRQDRTVVIPNGIDADLFRPKPGARDALCRSMGLAPDRFLVGLFARYAPMKDHANLFRAIRALLNDGHPVHLLLAGTGVDGSNEALVQAIKQQSLITNVTLLGERHDIPELMPALDVFVLPSLWGEACPLVLAEAMAAGVPCVATDVGDCRRILPDPANLVPPGNSVALANAILRTMEFDPEVRISLANRGRHEVLTQYSISKMTVHYLSLYSNFLRHPLSSESASQVV